MKRSTKILSALGLGLLAIALLHALLGSIADTRVRKELSALREAGRPMSPEEVIPPAVPDAENAAILYETAFPLLQSALVGTQEVTDVLLDITQDMLDNTASTGQLQQAREALAEIDHTVLSLVRQGTQKPGCRFTIDYTAGPAMQLGTLMGSRNLSRAMAVSAMVKARDGDMQAAWDEAEAMLRLANGLRSAPAIICQLIRLAQVDLGIETIAALCAIRPPNGGSRNRLSGHLLRLEDRSPFVLAIDGERLLFGEWMFRNFGMRVSDEGEFEQPPFGMRLLAGPWLSINRAHYLRVLRYYVSGMQQPLADFAFGEAGERAQRIPRYCVLARMIVPGLDGFYVRYGERLAQARLARIGLALEAHRERHGELPDDLQAISVSSLPEVPRDPFTGNDFVYRPGKGLVYSLGQNRQDDGGSPRPEGGTTAQANKWDVIWKFPAEGS